LLTIAAARIAGRSVAEGVGVGVGVGETEGLRVGVTTFTPLFHTSLVPDLMQVYLIPAETVVDLSLLQLVPVLVAAVAGVMCWSRKSEAQNKTSKRRFIFIL
jgi:di/tricarboxylate transporter